jgi:hypothetical protein
VCAVAHGTGDPADQVSIHCGDDVSALVFALTTIRIEFLSDPRLSVEHNVTIAFDRREFPVELGPLVVTAKSALAACAPRDSEFH